MAATMKPRAALLAPRGVILVSGPQGGSSVVLLEDAEILERAGWAVEICARAADPKSRIKRMPLRSARPLVGSLDYCGHFVAHAGHVVLVAYNEPTVAVLAPDRAVVRFDWATPLPRYWRLPPARRRFLRALYLFPSEALRTRWSRAHPGIPACAMRVIHNGIDTTDFRPADQRSDRLIVGFAGQWSPEKGVQVLLDAWPIVRRTVPQAELWLAGGPDLWKGTRREAPGAADVARRVNGSGLEGLVSVGVLPRGQMPAFWGNVSVACLPSVCEDVFPLVALEAMACGVPVVHTNRGGLPEAVGPGGLLVRAGDPGQLAKVLVHLLIDSNLRLKLGALARRRAEAFSLERRRRKLLSLLEGIWERVADARGLGSSKVAAEEDRDGAGAASLDV
jgi:glycosyltransferase involved in cell wall biosynthesis